MTVRRIVFIEQPVTSEITHLDPPRPWGVRGIDGQIRAAVGVSVDPTDDEGRASRLMISITFHGRGVGMLLVPLAVHPQALREMPANLARLKQNVEGQPAR